MSVGSNLSGDLGKKAIQEVESLVPHILAYRKKDKKVRDDVMAEVLHCRYWGVRRNLVLVVTDIGRIRFDVRNDKEVMVTFVPSEWCTSTKSIGNVEWYFCWVDFFVWKYRLSGVSQFLKSRADKRVPYEMIYDGKV
jgi:hypothetical protein